ncbi:MAG: universal stress protein [Candidatus Rokubacteria bacterium]|nr:universal stress protein [Candidatus Rokubacteria bacterium]
MGRQILVPLDGTVAAEGGLVWARREARRAGSSVHVLMVRPPTELLVVDGPSLVDRGEVEMRARARATAYLSALVLWLRASAISATFELRLGDLVDTILQVSREVGADLIALGGPAAEGVPGLLDRRALGEIAVHASVPVVVTAERGWSGPAPAVDTNMSSPRHAVVTHA